MTDWVNAITNVIVLVEIVAAVVLAFINLREVRFLEGHVKPLLRDGEDLPLFHALNNRAKYVSFVGVYLLCLTGFGALFGPVSEFFPPIRAINGALLLGLIAGPRVVGQALRAKVNLPEAES